MAKQRSRGDDNFEELFGARRDEQPLSGLKLIAHERIQTGPQPRTSFPPDELDELAASISTLRERGEGIEGTGILQPLIVAPEGDSYKLIAGERRFRASQQAGLPHVPAIVVALREEGVLTAQLIENLQRRDLPPIEEARGFGQLMSERGLSVRDAATLLGKPKSYLSDRLALLKMGEDVQTLVSDRSDTLLHARLLDGVQDPVLRAELVQATRESASRREIERRIIEHQSATASATANDSEEHSPAPATTGDGKTTASGAADSPQLSDRSDSSSRVAGRQLDATLAQLEKMLNEAAQTIENSTVTVGKAERKKLGERLGKVASQARHLQLLLDGSGHNTEHGTEHGGEL